MLRALLITGLACAACAAPKASLATRTAPAFQKEAPASLESDPWRTTSAAAFELWLPRVAELPPQSASQLDALAATSGQDTDPMAAARAALILARLDDEAAAARLADQLEALHPHPERNADASDTIAAAALATSRFATALDAGPRLAALALDSSAHPDLEVRTECARAALRLGHTEVAPFLLRLTRLGTALGRERDGDWHSSLTTTWSRNRAAETLADYLGIACPYRGDSSLAQREAAALALEAAWKEAQRKSAAPL